MFRNIFSHIDNITIFPIITMILFMLVFIGVIIYAFKLNKKSVDYYSNLPLDDKENKKINLE